MLTIDDFNFQERRALIRVDFNVPLNSSLEVLDDTRIQAAIPTLQKILNDGGSIVLMSHLGRPEGREAKFSLHNIVNRVSEALGVEVNFVADCVSEEAFNASRSLKPGEVLLLENLRFHPEEKKGDTEFAKLLAKHGDIYVNDAFGTAHRAHASTARIAEFMKDKCFGYLMAAEIKNINKILHSSDRPVTAIIGGAKVSSKITVIENILDKIDHLIIGGGMSYTFAKAMGGSVGDSLVEEDYLEVAQNILNQVKKKEVELHLPVDSVVADSFSNEANRKIERTTAISSDWMGLDIGPETVKKYREVIIQSKIILWNGPMGVFEFTNFEEGTRGVGQAVVEATENGAFSLVGGGDSVAAAKKFELENQLSYISTGGGAMLEMLEGKTLPGISAILQ